MSKEIIKNYGGLLAEIKSRVRSAQYAALNTVNKELVGLYWDIGRLIEEKQQGETWGKSIVEILSSDLRLEFPGVKGFSPSNLWRMKVFHGTYVKNEKLAQLVREIGWGHNVLIMESIEDAVEREFYIRMTMKLGWSRAVLVTFPPETGPVESC